MEMILKASYHNYSGCNEFYGIVQEKFACIFQNRTDFDLFKR